MKKITNDFKNKKAITLISLVVTIVILVILAAVAINMTIGNNGLFNKAKLAKGEYTNAADKERKDVDVLVNDIDTSVGANPIISARGDLQWDEIFSYDASDPNKKADAAGTYQLSLGTGKTSINQYKGVYVFSMAGANRRYRNI